MPISVYCYDVRLIPQSLPENKAQELKDRKSHLEHYKINRTDCSGFIMLIRHLHTDKSQNSDNPKEAIRLHKTVSHLPFKDTARLPYRTSDH